MIDEIKNKIDIVDFISQYVLLKGAGNYYKGLCPFHSDKNPSFFVSPEKQIFKCFGCGEWGSVIDFFMKMENVEFKEALKALAEKAGIEIKEFSSETKKERNIVIEINRVAVRFYKNKLKENKDALKYLTDRGLEQSTIDYFELGYAPAQNELRDYLFSLDYSLKDIQLAGLLTFGKEDRFRERIIFPFVDYIGKIVGFTGRVFPENDKVAKYINTSETQLFKKSQFLYGFYYAVPYIKEEKNVIVVEGQMDFLIAWQNGIKNIVAISGTAFTEDQLKILKRYTKKIVFALDEDEAGLRATIKSVPVAIKLGFDIQKLIFSDAKDLGEFLANGAKIEQTKTVSLIKYLFDYGLQNFDMKTAEGKKNFIELILPQIKFFGLVEKSDWISEISKITNINEELLYKELDKIQLITKAINRDGGLMVNNQFKTKLLVDDKYLTIIERLLAVMLALGKINLTNEFMEYLEQKKELIRKIKDNIFDEEVEVIKLRALYEQEKNPNLEDELNFLIKEIKKEYLRIKINELKYVINFKNEDETDKILEEVKSYTVLLKEL